MTRDWTIDEVRQRYDGQAEGYASRYRGLKGAYYRQFEDGLFLNMLDASGKRVLDLGTGRGRLAFLLAEHAAEVVGVDLSAEMIRLAVEQGKDYRNLTFEQAEASRLRFDNHAFDVVASAGMFAYFAQPAPYFREVNRVLAPGGILVFSVSNADEWRWPEDAYVAVRSRLRGLRGRASTVTSGPLAELVRQRVEGDDGLSAQLHDAGFELIDYRTTFFFIPSKLFYWAGRRGLSTLQRAAATANGFLGQWRQTKRRGKVLVVQARKVHEPDQVR